MSVCLCLLLARLRALATNSASKLNVLWLNGNALCMNGAKISVFEKTGEVRLGSFLECHYG